MLLCWCHSRDVEGVQVAGWGVLTAEGRVCCALCYVVWVSVRAAVGRRGGHCGAALRVGGRDCVLASSLSGAVAVTLVFAASVFGSGYLRASVWRRGGTGPFSSFVWRAWPMRPSRQL